MLRYLESVLEGVFLGRPICMFLSDLNSKYAIDALTYMFRIHVLLGCDKKY